MYEVYLYSRTGRCLAPVYYDDLDDALSQVQHFVQAVPYIVVIDSDGKSVFQSNLGKVIIPAEMSSTTEQYELDETKLYHTVDIINKLHHLVPRLARAKESDRRGLKSEINHLNLYVQGFGAATCCNVYHLGYCNPDAMIEEWETGYLKHSA